jgi:receptor expression-enhancing protein 5/6
MRNKKEENKFNPARENKEHEESLYDKYLEQMNIIKEKTGIPGTFVMGALLAAMGFVWIGFLERFITNLIGTVYPAFWTIKSIESRGEDDKQWLTYWVVFACFTTLEMFSGFILRYIPFYFFLKIVFLIWLFMPNSQGCHIIYHMLVIRVFKSFEQDIDHATGKIGEMTKDIITQGNNMIEKNRSNVVSGVVAAAANVALKKDSSPFGRAVKDPICSAGKKDEAKKDLLKKEVKKEPLNNIKILASKNKKI